MENKLSVSQLNNYVKGVFSDELVLQNIAVYGEVFEISSSAQTTYITLKEGDCTIRCVKYSAVSDVKKGEQILLFGSVSFYKRAGTVNFLIKSIEKLGKGELFEELLKLKEKLLKEGLFENKYKLPAFIRRVGVITSSTGAVIHDFLSVVTKQCPYVEVDVIQSRVQGEEAVSDLVNAAKTASKGFYDVVVIARGGGSLQDLDCFNNELVVRALAAIPAPTISAVGHETDYTLSDLVCSLRAGTPSIASKIVVDQNLAMESRFRLAVENIEYLAKRKLDDGIKRLHLGCARVLQSAVSVNEYFKLRIYNFADRARQAAERKYAKEIKKLSQFATAFQKTLEQKYYENDKRLSVLIGAVDAKNPMKLLKQGYGRVELNGKSVNSSATLKKNDLIDIYFVDGKVKAKITEK